MIKKELVKESFLVKLGYSVGCYAFALLKSAIIGLSSLALFVFMLMKFPIMYKSFVLFAILTLFCVGTYAVFGAGSVLKADDKVADKWGIAKEDR